MAHIDGSLHTAKEAVRFELRRAGFEVAADDQERTADFATVIVMLADGHYVQRDVFDRWYVHLYAAPGTPDEGDDPITAGEAEDW
jgi:3-hydroxyisobutyrate dehydrogenase-like beta-hydroxyacid dehydrogenase